MPIRPPGRVTRKISDSIRSASHSSNTVEDKATSTPHSQEAAPRLALRRNRYGRAAPTPGQGTRLTQQKGTHIAADQPVGASGAPRQLADDHARAAAYSRTLSPDTIANVSSSVRMSRYSPKPPALLETGDAAEQRSAKDDGAIVRGQRRDQRLPLARRQIERQQHQWRSHPAHPKGDAGNFAFRSGRLATGNVFWRLRNCFIAAPMLSPRSAAISGQV